VSALLFGGESAVRKALGAVSGTYRQGRIGQVLDHMRLVFRDGKRLFLGDIAQIMAGGKKQRPPSRTTTTDAATSPGPNAALWIFSA
jgi:hypothetical protein